MPLTQKNTPYNEQTEILHTNLCRMLESKTNTDVIIECDGEEFNVHKLVLVSSSNYFKRMFESSFQESSSDRISFPTIRKETMKIIIEFIYLSLTVLPTDQKIVAEIFQAAHLLEVNPLIDYCSKKLMENLNVENFLQIWLLTDLYQNADMIAGIYEFLLSNLERIMISDNFVFIPYENIVVLINKINETKMKGTDYMLESLLKWVKHEKVREIYFQKLCTSFKEFEFSSECISYLVSNEQLVAKNAEILLMFLRYQMKLKKDGNTYTEGKGTFSVVFKRFVKNRGWQPSGSSYSSSERILPFKITFGMTYVWYKNSIYFIGGDKEDLPKSDLKNSLTYEKGSDTVIHYDTLSDIFEKVTPLPYSVYNAKALIQQDKLYVIGKHYSTKDSKVYIQSCNLPDCYYDGRLYASIVWTATEVGEDLTDSEFLSIVNDEIICLKKITR